VGRGRGESKVRAGRKTAEGRKGRYRKEKERDGESGFAGRRKSIAGGETMCEKVNEGTKLRNSADGTYRFPTLLNQVHAKRALPEGILLGTEKVYALFKGQPPIILWMTAQVLPPS
jgi:hypothetical protein